MRKFFDQTTVSRAYTEARKYLGTRSKSEIRAWAVQQLAQQGKVTQDQAQDKIEQLARIKAKSDRDFAEQIAELTTGQDVAIGSSGNVLILPTPTTNEVNNMGYLSPFELSAYAPMSTEQGTVLVAPPNIINVSSNEQNQKTFYEKADVFLGGLLPGGASRTDVRAQNILDQTASDKDLYEAKLQAQKAEDQYKAEKLANDLEFTAIREEMQKQKDLINNTWVESLGIARSQEEKSLQDDVLREQYYLLQAQQVVQTAAAFNTSQAAQAANPSYAAASVPLLELTKNNTTTALLIGGSILAALFLGRATKR